MTKEPEDSHDISLMLGCFLADSEHLLTYYVKFYFLFVLFSLGFSISSNRAIKFCLLYKNVEEMQCKFKYDYTAAICEMM